LKRSSPQYSNSTVRQQRPAGDAVIERLRSALSFRVVRTVGEYGLKLSAVLLLLYSKHGEHHLLLNKRTNNVDVNKGEICFPGGGIDPGDNDLVATALRETYEEMGILSRDVTVLGELDETTTRAGFVIRPYVGTIPYPYRFHPSPAEVAEVLEVPVSWLLNSDNVRMDTESHYGEALAISYSYGGHLIYGATARILRQFLEILVSVGLPEGNTVK
jgi:8-oxo-dGTP pyrophosphatase MutT (NUDIX family)